MKTTKLAQTSAAKTCDLAMMRALVAVCALLVIGQASGAHLTFETLDGWQHSDADKWKGRFVVESPIKGLETKALKVILEWAL